MTFKIVGNNIFITRGDTPTLGFSAAKYNLDLTDNKFLFVVKRLATDSDDDIIFQYATTFNLTTKIAQIPLSTEQTTLTPGKYYWGTKLFIGETYTQTTNGGEFIIERGISDVRPE